MHFGIFTDVLIRNVSNGSSSATVKADVNQARPLLQIQDVLKDPTLTSPVWMTTVNKAFLDFLENLLCSISRLHLHPNIVIICEEEEVYRSLVNKFKHGKVRVVVTNQEYTSPLVNERLTVAYKQLMQKRVAYIELFIRNGFDIFFLGADIVLLQDPFPYFQGNYDLFVQIERPGWQDRYLGGGFFYLKWSNSAIAMVEQWQQLLKEDPKGNQVAFQRTLYKMKDLKILGLPFKQFSSGLVFFNSTQHWTQRRPPQVSVHSNWIVGKDPKKQKLKSAGLWFLNGRECVSQP